MDPFLNKVKASEFATSFGCDDFKASEGWLGKFKTRHGIAFKEVAGEENAVTADMTPSWNETALPTILSKYALRDIYNCDEFGLFYQALPNKTLHLKGKRCSGGKYRKARLTGLCGANALGEKLPLFVIGKSAKPRCFKNVKYLPCRYRCQCKSWMTGELFQERLFDLDRRMERDGRNICMIVDNCPAHPNVDGIKATELRKFPPNTTSKTQPMDQGVIRSTKAKYRSSLIFKMLRAVDSGLDISSVSMIDAMVMLNNARNDVTPETIVNCFRKAGLSSFSQEQAVHDLDDPFHQDSEDLESCILGLRQEGKVK